MLQAQQQEQAKKLVLSKPTIIFYDTSSDSSLSIKSKVDDLQKLLGFSKQEIVAMIKKYPTMLEKDVLSDLPTSIKSKIQQYEEIFGISNSDVKSMIKKSAQLLQFDTISNSQTSVKSKVRDYAEILKMPDNIIKNMIYRFPQLLNLDTISNDEKSIRGKVRSYQDLLCASHKEIAEMIIKKPTLLGFDVSSNSQKSILTKTNYLLSFLKTKDIIRNPIVLTMPALRVKSRYLILTSNIDKDELNLSEMIASEQVLWAKKKFLEDIGGNPKHIVYSQREFSSIYGVSVDDLVEKYQLQESDIHNLEQEYFEKYNKNITLDTYEINEVIK